MLANDLRIISIEENELLNRLEPVKTGYRLDRCCMSGTREALLNTIVEWTTHLRPEDTTAQGSRPDMIYWLYGIPGIGKTSMAHSICAQLHEKGRLGGSFFCQRDDPNLSDPKSVLPTLICQLADTWRPYRKLVADRLRKDPRLNRDSTGYELLSKLIGSLQNHPSHPIALVIDAFDECGDNKSRAQVLKGLFDAVLQTSWLKIIITSRPEQDIEAFFAQLPDGDRYTSYDLATDDKAQKDIRIFAQTRMESVALDCGLPKSWSDKHIDILVERSGGLFIFIETIWRLMKDDDDPEKILFQAVAKASGDALTDLHKLYSSVIESRIKQNKQSFHSAIGAIIVVSSHRSLPDETIAELVGLEPRLVWTWVNKLNSLLYREGGDRGPIRVRHLSIVDFLTSPNCPSDFRVDIDEANSQVGLGCLKVMIKGLRFNICDIESSFIPNKDVNDLDTRIKENISDGLQYSCMYWANHVYYGPDIKVPDVYDQLDEFTRGYRLLYWMEVLSLLGEVPVGESALRLSLKKVCKV
jgi:hypothetical protein